MCVACQEHAAAEERLRKGTEAAAAASAAEAWRLEQQCAHAARRLEEAEGHVSEAELQRNMERQGAQEEASSLLAEHQAEVRGLARS